MHRLRATLDVHQDCRDLHDHVAAGRHGLPARLDTLARRRSDTPFHIDRGMALWSGAAAVVAILLVCAFWILTGWPSGAAAAMMVAVFCSFFATMDDPAPGIRLFLVFTLLSVPAAALYLLLVLPAATSFEMLAVAMAPSFLLLGVYIGRPETMGRAMALTFGIGGALSLHDIGSADFPSFLNSTLAQIMGVATAMVVTQLVRSVGAAWSARRLLRAGWAELAELAARTRAPEPGRFENRMLDRIGLLSPRLALCGPLGDLAAIDAVNDLRIGLNIADIQRARPLLDGSDRCIARLMEGLRDHFRALARLGAAPPPPALLERIDAAIAGLATAPPAAQRERALAALAGLRRSLFPDAPIDRSLVLERAA